MSDGNQETGPFREALAAQVHDAVLRSHILCLEARGDHAGTGREGGHNLAPSLIGTGGEGNEGASAFGEGAAVHEIVLAAHAGEDFLAYGVRADLAGEVHFQGGIDGTGPRVLRNEERIVGIGHVKKLHGTVVVDVLVHLL